MARIIENIYGTRRMIKLTTNDIISVVQDYQRIVPRTSNADDIRKYLSDTVIFLPEDI